MDVSSLTDSGKVQLKQLIKDTCCQLLQQRIDTLQAAMQSAQEAANSEDKSSAGDKYETSRAMGHLQQEMLVQQLEDAQTELAIVKALSTETLHSMATPGAVVVCSSYILFLAAGLGAATVQGQKVFMVSSNAPLAQAVLKKRAGDSFTFNGKTQSILTIF